MLEGWILKSNKTSELQHHLPYRASASDTENLGGDVVGVKTDTLNCQNDT